MKTSTADRGDLYFGLLSLVTVFCSYFGFLVIDLAPASRIAHTAGVTILGTGFGMILYLVNKEYTDQKKIMQEANKENEDKSYFLVLTSKIMYIAAFIALALRFRIDLISSYLHVYKLLNLRPENAIFVIFFALFSLSWLSLEYARESCGLTKRDAGLYKSIVFASPLIVWVLFCFING